MRATREHSPKENFPQLHNDDMSFTMKYSTMVILSCVSAADRKQTI